MSYNSAPRRSQTGSAADCTAGFPLQIPQYPNYDRKYEELYKYISNSDKTNISCDIEDVEGNSKEMKVTFKVNDNPIYNFYV